MTAAWGGREPRAWQADALPLVLGAIEARVPSIVRAVTGSGKSVLIAEVIASRLPHLRAGEVILVSTPTQALTAQLVDTIGVRVGRDLVGAYYQHARRVDTPVIVVCHASLYGEVDLVCPLCATVPAVGVRWLTGQDAKDVRAAWVAGVAGALRTSRCLDLEAHRNADVASLASGLTRALAHRGLTVALHIADECHKTVTAAFGAHISHARPDALIGFTATPYRSKAEERLSHFDEVVYDYGLAQAIRDKVILLPTLIPYSGTSERANDACLEMILAHLERHPGSPGVVSADSIVDAEGYADLLSKAGVRAEAIHSRLARDEQVSLLERLRVGALDALVHVRLLVEGVDLPWLEWLCMRSASCSRVRFAQEVGRVVRSHQGKTQCWVMDVHDLWGKLSLDYEAVLGCLEGYADERDMVDDEAALEGGGDGDTMRDHGVCGLTGHKAWLRAISNRIRLTGGDALRSASVGRWREDIATPRQIGLVGALLKKIGKRGLEWTCSPVVREHLRELCRGVGTDAMSKGDVADLITVLKSLEGGVLPPVEVV